jgi:hypothetical protein
MTNIEAINRSAKKQQQTSMRGRTVTGQDVILNNTISGNVIKHTGKIPILNYHSTRVHVRIHPLCSCVMSEDWTVLGRAVL